MSPAFDPRRLAAALRWLRWPALIVWVLAVMALFPLAHSVSGAETTSATANLQSSSPSTRVLQVQQAARRGQSETDTATVVFARGTGPRTAPLTASDLTAASAARSAVAHLAGHATGLGLPGPAQRSADGRAVAFSAPISSPASTQDNDAAAVQAIRSAVAGPANQAGDGLRAAVTGPAAVSADTNITAGSNTLLLTALLVVTACLLVVSVLAYRSLLLWLLPLIGDLAAIGIARAGAHELANAGVTITSLSVSILTVMVLGVATDYALLLISRYREELRQHATAEEAMAVALRRTFPTLLASAATVICAMLCLLAAGSAALNGLGPVSAAGITAALLAQVTFLPALLLACGRMVFWPRIPRHGELAREGSRLWAGVGNRVSRHPARVAVKVVALLGAACIGLAALHTDNSPVATVPGHPGSVTGAQLLTEHFPADDREPLTVLTPPGEAAAATTAAKATPGVTAVTATTPPGGYASFQATLSAADYSAGAYATIAVLRANLDRAAPGSLVGGALAVQYDITQAARQDDLVLIPLILVAIFIVIALLLRALVVPLVLVASAALSFGASFGLSALVWRYVLGYSGIEAQLPMYIFVFLVALGADYNVFLSARIREEAQQHGIVQGTLRGLRVTGGVITAAGFVLAATFADLATLAYVPVTEVGIAVALGVLIDTLLVRTVLVPASLLAIGKGVWWPRPAAGTKPRPAAVRP